MTGVRPLKLFAYVVRLGDNALVLGQRLSEWTGHGPILEEDLALTNVALDLIGQARFWLAYAAEVEGRGRGEDDLAYYRDAHEFGNVLLVEQRNGDYARTTARQFLFDAWHRELLHGLAGSSDARIAAIAQKAALEVEYHLRRSTDWVLRLGDGTDESRRRIQSAVDDLWPFTGELFRSDEVDLEMLRAGIGVEFETLRDPWLERVRRTFAAATLAVPADGWMQSGGKSGRHGEHLSYLLAEMQSVRRAVPGDRW
jgi:ring-1,2-phenylacetyl-CoA epoxidase subunit PaaC